MHIWRLSLHYFNIIGHKLKWANLRHETPGMKMSPSEPCKRNHWALRVMFIDKHLRSMKCHTGTSVDGVIRGEASIWFGSDVSRAVPLQRVSVSWETARVLSGRRLEAMSQGVLWRSEAWVGLPDQVSTGSKQACVEVLARFPHHHNVWACSHGSYPGSRSLAVHLLRG